MIKMTLQSRGVIQSKEQPMEETFAVDCSTVRLFHECIHILAATFAWNLKVYSDIIKMKNTFQGGEGGVWGGGGGGGESNSFRGQFVLITKAW